MLMKRKSNVSGERLVLGFSFVLFLGGVERNSSMREKGFRRWVDKRIGDMAVWIYDDEGWSCIPLCFVLVPVSLPLLFSNYEFPEISSLDFEYSRDCRHQRMMNIFIVKTSRCFPSLISDGGS